MVIFPHGTKTAIEEKKVFARARVCVYINVPGRDLPGGVSNEGISDFYYFANFRDKCLISNEIELRYAARVNDDTRNCVLRAIKYAIKISNSFRLRNRYVMKTNTKKDKIIKLMYSNIYVKNTNQY